MKNVIAFFTLLLVCSITGNVKAQSSFNNAKPSIKLDLLGLNFIDNISFTPGGNNTADVITAGKQLTKAPVNKTTGKPTLADGIEKVSTTIFKYAMLMDVNVEALTDVCLYNFIDEWFGTHYRMGGTTKKGIDCSAFTSLLLASVYSLTLPRTAREQYNICEHINKENLMSGDLVFFNTRGGVSHVGVYLTNGQFVHSSSSDGVKISSLDDGYYSRKFISGGRVNQ